MSTSFRSSSCRSGCWARCGQVQVSLKRSEDGDGGSTGVPELPWLRDPPPVDVDDALLVSFFSAGRDLREDADFLPPPGVMFATVTTSSPNPRSSITDDVLRDFALDVGERTGAIFLVPLLREARALPLPLPMGDHVGQPWWTFQEDSCLFSWTGLSRLRRYGDGKLYTLDDSRTNSGWMPAELAKHPQLMDVAIRGSRTNRLCMIQRCGPAYRHQ